MVVHLSSPQEAVAHKGHIDFVVGTCNLKGIYMRPISGRYDIQNLYRYETFAAVYLKPGRNAWCLVSGRNVCFVL